MKDVLNDKNSEEELMKGGGQRQVPCLRIEENGQTTWMYESKVIIDYLDKRFAAAWWVCGVADGLFAGKPAPTVIYGVHNTCGSGLARDEAGMNATNPE